MIFRCAKIVPRNIWARIQHARCGHTHVTPIQPKKLFSSATGIDGKVDDGLLVRKFFLPRHVVCSTDNSQVGKTHGGRNRYVFPSWQP